YSPTGRGSRLKPGRVRVRVPLGAPRGERAAARRTGVVQRPRRAARSSPGDVVLARPRSPTGPDKSALTKESRSRTSGVYLLGRDPRIEGRAYRWVRSNRHPRAVETVRQRRWIEKVATSVAL